MNAQTIHVYGAKGGVGTSTVAALIALEAQRDGYRVSLRAGESHGDADRVADLRGILGHVDRSDDLYICLGPDDGPPLIVRDQGVWDGSHDGDGPVYIVARACYLSARRMVDLPRRVTGIILVEEPGRALQVADIEAVAERPVVARVPVTERTARFIDSGLLATRASYQPRLGLVPAPVTA